MSHINQSCWGQNTVWGPARGIERDLFVHTCESINKLTALWLWLFVSLSFCFFLSVFLNASPPCSLSPSLQHTPHWRLHFSPFKSFPNWHSVRRGKASPECTSLTIPRHVHMNASLHRNTWISLLTCSPSALRFKSSLLREATNLIEKMQPEEVSKRILHCKQYCLKSKSSNNLSRGIPRIILWNLWLPWRRLASQWYSTVCRTASASINEEGQVWDYLSHSPSLLSSAPLLSSLHPCYWVKTHRCERQTWLTMHRLPPSRNTRNCSVRGCMLCRGHTLCSSSSPKYE